MYIPFSASYRYRKIAVRSRVFHVVLKVKSKYFHNIRVYYPAGVCNGHATYLCVAGNEIVNIIFMMCRIQSVTAIFPQFLATAQNVVAFWKDISYVGSLQ
jgi:hypothetical protein